MEFVCLKCGSTACVKNGFHCGVQRYKCKVCSYQFTKLTPRGKPERDKILALALYLSGLSMRMTAKIIGVSVQSVMRWIRESYHKYAERPEFLQRDMDFEEIEIDEMHHFLCKKNSNFGSGKFLIMRVELSSGGYAAIVVPKPS
jgi:transposase-like protein